MARPVKFNAAPKAASASARTPTRATKAVKFGAARGGPRGGKANGGVPYTGGKGGGYNSGAKWSDIPD